MTAFYKNIVEAKARKERLLAILIDPDKMDVGKVFSFITKVNQTVATHIFVGGSVVNEGVTDEIVNEIKYHTNLPVILFPGDLIQITDKADALLYLSLISGRNPDFLIGKHVESIPRLKHSEMEIISTGYILIENGKPTSVEKVSKTKPLNRNDINTILNTALAGELLGLKMIYLEAGSGATHPVNEQIIEAVKKEIKIPLIVGGGIRTKTQIEAAYSAGADMVVIGTALEKDETFFNQLKL